MSSTAPAYRGLLRRALWLGPTLLFVTLVAFGVLASALPDASARRLPLFVNVDPAGVERLAQDAVARLASGEDEGRAADELARLGGAALPFVLPTLDTLTPEGRLRVVQALVPVRERMGFDDPVGDPGQEVLFWSRFWEEHSIDFRPVVAEQAVRRLAQRASNLRSAEVRRLDTYALGEIIRRMPPVDGAADVARVSVLSELAAHMTGEPSLRVARGDEVARARRVVDAWQVFWSVRRADYTNPRGFSRLVAMFRDTRYGRWVSDVVRRELGPLGDGESAWDALRRGARVTLPLVGAGFAGSWLLGVVAAALAAGVSTRARRLVWLAAGLGAALPAVVLAALLAPSEGAAPLWVGALVMFVASAPFVSLSSVLGDPSSVGARFVRTLRALGASPWQAARSTVKLSSPALLTQLGTQGPRLLTLAFVVEHALGLPGLGPRTIAAVHAAELNWLMAITLVSTVVVIVLSALGELAVSGLDPRLHEGAPRAGAFE